MIEETQREGRLRIGELLNSLPCTTDNDKLKFYSWKEIRDNNKIVEVKKEELKRFDIKYCDIHKFCCHLGNICWICQTAKTGLGNPDVHKKTINAQIKNGTFNMLNAEVQKNKTSNVNLKSKIKLLYCKECNKDTKHFVWKDAIKCCVCNAKDNGLQKRFCNKCNKETIHNGNICTNCNPIAAIQNNLHHEYCEICNSITYHNGKFCLKCNPESYSLHPLSFIEGNNCLKHKEERLMYFNNKNKNYICWSCFKEEFKLNKDIKNIDLSQKIKCKQCGKISEPNSIFCCNSCEETYKKDKYYRFKHNNICKIHLNNILSYNKECWECYKEKFENSNINFYSDFLNWINKSYQNALIQTTYRPQESSDWAGSSGAFEKDLVERKIGWMCYIKFYIDKSKMVLPLVVGKTGSYLVNNSGTDVNFSTDVNHGPSRKFLKDNKLEWDKTNILVIPCDNEEFALSVEKEIISKYNLFES